MVLSPFGRWAVCLILVFVVLTSLSVGGYFIFQSEASHDTEPTAKDLSAVVTNGYECSKIASDILRRNSSAADAMVAALICEGVTCAQSTGIGGGLVATIYTRANRKVEALLAREQAPLAATETMFANEKEVTGIKAVAVPGEIKGLWEMHQRYGKLPWATLLKPTIELCRNGHTVTRFMGEMLSKYRETIINTPSLAEVFINPRTKEPAREGDKLKRLKLADTLEILAKEGADSMYKNGTIGQLLVNDLQKLGSIITAQDFMEYNVRWEEPVVGNILNGLRVVSVPPPASGALVIFMLQILDGFIPDDMKTAHIRIAESFKYAYARRSELADPHFVDISELQKNLTDSAFAANIRDNIDDTRTYNNYSHYGAQFTFAEDHGTANVVVIAPNGDTIVATSSVNTLFGAKLRSTSTGIILNDSMDDFSAPGIYNGNGLAPSPVNFIKPKKIALSSMCPTIIIDDNGDVRLAIGAAGGTKITSSVAYSIIRHLYMNETLQQAMNAPRIHHQLVPMDLQYEKEVDANIVTALRDIGHRMSVMSPDGGFAAATAIARVTNKYSAVFDKRRLGSFSIF